MWNQGLDRHPTVISTKPPLSTWTGIYHGSGLKWTTFKLYPHILRLSDQILSNFYLHIRKAPSIFKDDLVQVTLQGGHLDRYKKNSQILILH